jgi:Na+-driven multidrug efflux pump
MPTLGVMMALVVRMGQMLTHGTRKAKRLAGWCMLFTTTFGAVLAIILYIYRIKICMLFTDDEEVIRGCEVIWQKLCYYVFVLHIFGIQCAILRALGMQWRMAGVIFGCLWLGALPCMVYFYKGGGLPVVWDILVISYTIMQFFLVMAYCNSDWDSIAREIARRNADNDTEEVELEEETSSLLPRESRSSNARYV